MTVSFINQENEEITKSIAELIHVKFKENLWQLNSFVFCF